MTTSLDAYRSDREQLLARVRELEAEVIESLPFKFQRACPKCGTRSQHGEETTIRKLERGRLLRTGSDTAEDLPRLLAPARVLLLLRTIRFRTRWAILRGLVQAPLPPALHRLRRALGRGRGGVEVRLNELEREMPGSPWAVNHGYTKDICYPCRVCGAPIGRPCRATKTLTQEQVERGFVHFGRRLKRLLAEVPKLRGGSRQ